MWLRHFYSRRESRRYKKFESRYNEFHPDDIVLLCEKCHRTIHDIYFITITYYALRHGKLSNWSWARANNLMQMLSYYCRIWLNSKSLSDA